MNVSKEEYQQWRHHPVSKVYLQFLIDRKEGLIRSATEDWLNGRDSFAKDNQIDRGRIAELILMADVPFEAIEEFYKEEENEAEDTINKES